MGRRSNTSSAKPSTMGMGLTWRSRLHCMCSNYSRQHHPCHVHRRPSWCWRACRVLLCQRSSWALSRVRRCPGHIHCLRQWHSRVPCRPFGRRRHRHCQCRRRHRRRPSRQRRCARHHCSRRRPQWNANDMWSLRRRHLPRHPPPQSHAPSPRRRAIRVHWTPSSMSASTATSRRTRRLRRGSSCIRCIYTYSPPCTPARHAPQ